MKLQFHNTDMKGWMAGGRSVNYEVRVFYNTETMWFILWAGDVKAATTFVTLADATAHAQKLEDRG